MGGIKSKVGCLFLMILMPLSFNAQNGVPALNNAIPALNKEIVEYVTSVMGKKVDRGECWDLANEALRIVNARWNGNYKYGRLLNPATDSIYPGDLIQFENVLLKYEKDGRQYREQMLHHTAIVYRVDSKGVFGIAHQNTGQFGRKVGISELKLADITKGKVMFYRPESN
jgi:hypothetical protein